MGRVFDIQASRTVLLELMGYEPGWDRDLDARMFERAVDELEWVLDGVVARSEAADRLVEELVRLSDVVSERDEELIEVVLAAYRKEQEK